MCCLNEVSSIASTNGAFVAITVDGNAIPWGDAGYGGVFNNDDAIKQLEADKTKVKFTMFCIFFLSFTIYLLKIRFFHKKKCSVLTLIYYMFTNSLNN